MFLDVSGPLRPEELIRRQLAGAITDADGARAAVDALVRAGLVAPVPTDGEQRLAMQPLGRALFTPVRAAVTAATQALVDGIAPTDLEITQRVLAEVARRAVDRATALGGS